MIRRGFIPTAALAGVVIVLSAACSGDGEEEAETAPPPPPPQPLPPAFQLPVDESAPFVNDPFLERYLLRDSVELPDRFLEVARDDREPILSLGLVTGAARATYRAAITNEVLSVDVLMLEPDVDPGPFFTAFVDTLADNPNLRGVRSIGVVRGLGDSARRYAFTVEGDDAEAAALLRGDIIALVTYRRPPDFRQPLDLDALLADLDAAIEFDQREAAAEG